jgi:NOL1/NOP2/fmu family ribosome biogenesis protein
VDLDFPSAFLYAAGEEVEVPSSGRKNAGNGPVQVRGDGFVLGKGLLSGGRLTSQVSKGLRFVRPVAVNRSS